MLAKQVVREIVKSLVNLSLYRTAGFAVGWNGDIEQSKTYQASSGIDASVGQRFLENFGR